MTTGEWGDPEETDPDYRGYHDPEWDPVQAAMDRAEEWMLGLPKGSL